MEKNNLVEAVDALVKEYMALVEANELLRNNNERLRLRESIYQKELAKVKGTLLGISQSIDTTPHSRDKEYQEKFYKTTEEADETMSEV